MISAVCPTCGAKRDAADSLAGMTIKCKSCAAGWIALPAKGSATASDPTPPAQGGLAGRLSEAIRTAGESGAHRLEPPEDAIKAGSPKPGAPLSHAGRAGDNWEQGRRRPLPVSPYAPEDFRKPYTLGLVLIGTGIGALITGVILIRDGSPPAPLLVMFVIYAAIVVTIVGALQFMVLLYRAWNLIQDGTDMPSPGRAVGFLFIPLFNLYWTFVAIRGLSVEMNRFADRHDIDMPRLPVALGTTYCVLDLCSLIPYVGLLPGLVSPIVFLVYMNAIKHGAIDIVQALSYDPRQKTTGRSN